MLEIDLLYIYIFAYRGDDNLDLYKIQRAAFVQEYKDFFGYKTYQPRAGVGTTNTVIIFVLGLSIIII